MDCEGIIWALFGSWRFWCLVGVALLLFLIGCGAEQNVYNVYGG